MGEPGDQRGTRGSAEEGRLDNGGLQDIFIEIEGQRQQKKLTPCRFK